MFAGGAPMQGVLILCVVEHPVSIATSVPVHYLSGCAIACGEGSDSALC